VLLPVPEVAVDVFAWVVVLVVLPEVEVAAATESPSVLAFVLALAVEVVEFVRVGLNLSQMLLMSYSQSEA
jgi:hypothetical protein